MRLQDLPAMDFDKKGIACTFVIKEQLSLDMLFHLEIDQLLDAIKIAFVLADQGSVQRVGEKRAIDRHLHCLDCWIVDVWR